MSSTNNIIIPEQFHEIAPYRGKDFFEALNRLVNDPGFEHAVRYVMPDVDYPEFVKSLLQVKDQNEFQTQVMGRFLEMLAASTTRGLSIDGEENCEPGCNYTFMSNHRDIVLDPSFLNLCFIRSGLPVTQVAIGNNLLIYDWIADLVKVNRSFIVKRDTKVVQALEAAKQLSAYIHYTLYTLHESVWIAQREGRAKDSNDVTQESLIKMLALAGQSADLKEKILEVNLMPVSISYEFDPNDYLKAREFLLRRRDPEFKKSQRDDLFSMETGLLSNKGRVHFRIGKCINADLARLQSTDRAEIIRYTCTLIDRAIHCGYKIYPGNYIAYDEINATDRFASRYTTEDESSFNDYIERQLDRVEVADVTAEERAFMRRMMLTMYANPLTNQLAASEC
jgi:hypothetical protein